MAARERRAPGTPAEKPAAQRPSSQADGGSRLGWIGLAVAAVLTAWKVVYAVTAPGATNEEVYSSVGLLLSLVLAVGAVVLGIVALGQHAAQRWPATAALAVGTYAFIVSVATWIGGLV